jgi:hypothetical protein
MMNESRLTNSSNGRDTTGRFTTGNKGGPGNPHAVQVAVLRKALLAAVTPEDLQEVMSVLIERALGGNIGAIKELLDRVCGKPKIALEVKQETRSTDAVRSDFRSLIRNNPQLLENFGLQVREDFEEGKAVGCV